MTDRATMTSGIETWLHAITASVIGLDDGLQIRWRGEPAGWLADAHAIVYLPSPTGIGRDTVVYEEDESAAAGSEITFTQVGQRQVTIDVQIYSRKNSAGNDAAEYARRIRDRVMLPDWSSTLKAAGLAFQAITGDRSLTPTMDQREYTVHQIDVTMNCHSEEVGAPTGYIRLVEFETAFIKSDGTVASPIVEGMIEIEEEEEE